MAIVGPGFIITIALGYHYNEPLTPRGLDQAAIIALPIMLLGIAAVARSILVSDGTTPRDFANIDFFGTRRRRWRRESRLLSQQEQQRVSRLAADPALRNMPI